MSTEWNKMSNFAHLLETKIEMNNTPPVTKNLIIINLLCFLATVVLGREAYGINLNDILGMHFCGAEKFNLYQIFTYMFMHADFGHLFFNMFALWMFGRVLESVWGSQRFLFFYILCGMGAGLVQQGVQCVELLPYVHDLKLFEARPSGEMITINNTSMMASQWVDLCNSTLNNALVVGASGAVYAILMAFAMIFPNQPMYIIPFPMPIKTKWVIIGYIVIELYLGVTGNDGVAHFAHLGGMIFGFLLIMYWKKKGTFHGRHF